MRIPKEEDLQDFEGPLDVILYLLTKHKIEIKDVSISQILEQYVQWLELRKRLDLEIASEFIIMASHLMYIKTRMLLSLEDTEGQSELDALIQSLEERRRGERYAQLQEMVKNLAPLSAFGCNIFTRQPETMERDKIYEYSHTKEDLMQAMVEMQNRAQQALPPPQDDFDDIVGYEPYPVESKAREILSKLGFGKMATFFQLFRGSRSRSEVVATFLAVLELCKNRIILLKGENSDYHVEQISQTSEKME